MEPGKRRQQAVIRKGECGRVPKCIEWGVRGRRSGFRRVEDPASAGTGSPGWHAMACWTRGTMENREGLWASPERGSAGTGGDTHEASRGSTGHRIMPCKERVKGNHGVVKSPSGRHYRDMHLSGTSRKNRRARRVDDRPVRIAEDLNVPTL